MVKRYRADLLQDEISALFHRVDGLERVVVVSLDGFVVASYPPSPDDEEDDTPTNGLQIAATAASAISMARTALGRLDAGNWQQLIIDGESGAMILRPIGGTDAALAAVASKRAKIGLTSSAMGRSVSRLAAVLSRELDT